MGEFRVRLVPPMDSLGMMDMLRSMDVNERGVRIMASKGIHCLLWVEGFPMRGANILKQEMLARGGEVALPRAASLLEGDFTDCLLMGTLSQYRSLVKKLREQPYFQLPALADELQVALDEPPGKLDWVCRDKVFSVGSQTLIMGILNVTPDSFSDGGRYHGLEQALARAREMVFEGADIIDVGGESSRPGAHQVPLELELDRVIPVVKALVDELGVTVSVDTTKGLVARAALEAGAAIINDISGVSDQELLVAAAEHKAGLVLMHNSRGKESRDLWADVYRSLERMQEAAITAGAVLANIAVDPGLGFGKTPEENLELVRGVGNLGTIKRPILLGPSRKSVIGSVLDLPVEERLEGTLAMVAVGVFQGAHVIRVHDVRAGRRTARMAVALRRSRDEE